MQKVIGLTLTISVLLGVAVAASSTLKVTTLYPQPIYTRTIDSRSAVNNALCIESGAVATKQGDGTDGSAKWIGYQACFAGKLFINSSDTLTIGDVGTARVAVVDLGTYDEFVETMGYQDNVPISSTYIGFSMCEDSANLGKFCATLRVAGEMEPVNSVATAMLTPLKTLSTIAAITNPTPGHFYVIRIADSDQNASNLLESLTIAKMIVLEFDAVAGRATVEVSVMYGPEELAYSHSDHRGYYSTEDVPDDDNTHLAHLNSRISSAKSVGGAALFFGLVAFIACIGAGGFVIWKKRQYIPI